MDNLENESIFDLTLRELYFKWKDTNIKMYKDFKLYRKINIKNKDYSLALGIDLFIITLLLIILYM